MNQSIEFFCIESIDTTDVMMKNKISFFFEYNYTFLSNSPTLIKILKKVNFFSQNYLNTEKGLLSLFTQDENEKISPSTN